MKVVFLGTPEFAVASLKALTESDHEVVAVVSQPDRARDRKGNLLPTPVKTFAEQNGIKVYQFEKIRTEGVDVLKNAGADVMVTAAYGQILSREILQIAPLGVINVHASLLPKYRGSAPIQWAVINGEKETGITIMQTDVGIDNGAVLASVKTLIGETETAGELTERLQNIGAKLLTDTLDLLSENKIVPVPQDESVATKCRMLEKSDGHLDFSCGKREIVCRCNGVTPFPGAYGVLNGEAVKLGKVLPAEGNFGNCGRISVVDDEIIVACKDGGVKIGQLQFPGKKMLAAKEFLRGHKFDEGAEFV